MPYAHGRERKAGGESLSCHELPTILFNFGCKGTGSPLCWILVGSSRLKKGTCHPSFILSQGVMFPLSYPPPSLPASLPPSSHPQTRYLVGNVNGTPAYWLGWGIWLLNDRLMDRMISPPFKKGAR
jgi:hypothetical protein